MDAHDRISNLPTDIITEYILQRLPFKDVVKTSILSTCWRDKWTLLPELILDDSDIYYYLRDMREFDAHSSEPFDVEIIDAKMLKYSNIVNNILVCYDGRPVHKFVLFIPCEFTKDADISHWIHFASRKLVKEFTLYKNAWGGLGLLPSTMFSCGEFNHLTQLRLDNWSLAPVSTTFSGFPCLISLKLKFSAIECNGEVNKIGILVSKCPLLENLYLMIEEKESCLVIHAPKLQVLYVEGSLSDIFLEETERIKTISFDVWLDHERDLRMEFFRCLPLVEKLTVEDRFWSAERNCGELGQPLGKLEFPDKMGELKSLTLEGVRIYNKLGVTCMICLLQMSPKLEFLEITVCKYYPYYNGNASILTIEGDCCLDHLKTVKITTTLYEKSLPLIHMLLSSSPVLENMTVELMSYSPVHEEMTVEAYEKKCNLAKELSVYRRASANAEIILKDTEYKEGYHIKEHWMM